MRRLSIFATMFLVGTLARAQAPMILPSAQQIDAAVSALPLELRAGAAVLGYGSSAKLVELRKGKNGMICLASDPHSTQFHVACYHESLEPFMARGRALRAAGTQGAQVDTVRFAEVHSGKLKMPSRPAALYTLTAPAASYDAATGKVSNARPLYVVYMPFATSASTGISSNPRVGTPWLMFPGTPKAHIMFTPGM
jgi:hypothetical protein